MPKELKREELIKKTGELTEALRKELGSITLKEALQVDDAQLNDAEFNERANAAEIFFINHMERVLNAFEYSQLQEIGNKAQNDVQMVFGRGTINGFYLIREWFNQRISESRARFEPKEKVEPGEEF